jgi:hypothetical protein
VAGFSERSIDMQVIGWVILAVVVAVVVIAIVAWAISRQQKSRHLREQFGPEYERVNSTVKNKRQAEMVLEQRQKRIEKFNIRPLSNEDRTRYAASWREAQARFVDSPSDAIRDADRLVSEVMSTRGYPVENFEQQAADVSVDHPQVVSNYRAAHEIALNNERGDASTENLRQAMVHYRSLFDELLGVEQPVHTGA